jgi:hypothetical protein
MLFLHKYRCGTGRSQGGFKPTKTIISTKNIGNVCGDVADIWFYVFNI